jgi:hypothetical protein
LEASVLASARAMSWLEPSDQALVDACAALARTIDLAEDVKTVGWMAPHLMNGLRALGGAPAERKQLSPKGKPRGSLAAIRSDAAG